MRAAPLIGTLCLLFAGGCLRGPTEIIVVVDVDADLMPSRDFDEIQFQLPNQFGGGPGTVFPVGTATTLPATMGFLPQEGGRAQFDVIVAATRGGFMGTLPIVTRRVSNIPFVSGEMRAVFVSLLSQCKCEGTTCPNALMPQCRDIVAPVLEGFDEDHIPSLKTRPIVEGP